MNEGGVKHGVSGMCPGGQGGPVPAPRCTVVCMAIREHLRCPACGSTRPIDRFGPEHEACFAIQSVGGHAGIRWVFKALPRALAERLRDALAGALERLEADLRE